MRGTSRSWVAPVGLLGLMALPLSASAGQMVAVLDTVQAGVKLKLTIRSALASAMDDLHLTMVPMEDLTDDDGKCGEPTCTVEIAKRTSAAYLLFVDGVANPAGYRFTFELREGEGGRTLGTEAKDCELCADDQIAPAVRETIKTLWTRAMAEQAAAETQEETAPPPAELPGKDTSQALPWWKQSTPMLGLGLGAAGLIATGFGIYYVAQDGAAIETSPISGQPIWVRDTGRWGWTFVGVGLVAAMAGSAMLIWGRQEGANVGVAVGPGSLGLHGRF